MKMKKISAERRNDGVHLDIVLAEEEAIARERWLKKEIEILEQHIKNEQMQLSNFKRELIALESLLSGDS